MPKILILDDDYSNADAIKMVLEDQALDVQSICEAKKLKQTINNFKPDLIVMDILLDVGDGREICNQLKKDTQTRMIPVLLITAMLESDASSIPHLADDIIFKPFSYKTLQEKVANLIH